MREKAKPTVQIDDEKVKVTRWDFSPGAETGWHRHEMDYVVVPLPASDSYSAVNGMSVMATILHCL